MSLATILGVEFIGLLFLEAILVLGAIVGGVALAFVVADVTRGAVRGRRLTILIASLLPFMILVCLEGGVLAYGFAERGLGNDNFLDGEYHYPLTNGYRLSMFDKFPDHLYIEHISKPYDGVDNVRAVQVAGSLLLVSAYRGKDVSDWGEDKATNRYVEIDTKNFGLTDFPTLDALRSDAAEKGAALQLTPAADLLNLDKAKSPGWPGLVYFVLLLVPPAVLIWMFGKRLRRTRMTVLNATTRA